ncbi:MAG: TlpA family protein disulfide reductase [Hymenobacter sp.]|nr:TlpA family protein disulfide reductase [Hymenobacter sp.]
MLHLDSLQRRYPNDVQVVAISDDSEERLRRFLSKRPVSIPLVSDPAGKTERLFPRNTMPHTVVLSRQHVVEAITQPQALTETALVGLMQGQKVSLPPKAEEVAFDARKDYFSADTTTEYAFTLRPHVQGFPSYSRPGKGAFGNRGVSFVNVMPQMLPVRVRQIRHAHAQSAAR